MRAARMKRVVDGPVLTGFFFFPLLFWSWSPSLRLVLNFFSRPLGGGREVTGRTGGRNYSELSRGGQERRAKNFNRPGVGSTQNGKNRQTQHRDSALDVGGFSSSRTVGGHCWASNTQPKPARGKGAALTGSGVRTVQRSQTLHGAARVSPFLGLGGS